ncbi:MAG: phenylacetate--CoA ligase family protein, partial [Chloroflexota bacterium]
MIERTPLEAWIWRKIGAPGERLERTDLQAYQLLLLNDTLQRAARSPFYRRRLAGCPQQLASLEQIRRLP